MPFLTKKIKKPFLIEILGKRIITDDQGPVHLILEGETLPALTCLQDEYTDGIDLIFADPPKVDNPQFKTINDPQFTNLHNIFPGKKETDHHLVAWLCFLEKRIALAHSLLKPTGCFFISANNRNAAHLKLICDHIFSSENYITTFTIKTRHESRVLKKDIDIHNITEQLLFYRKSNVYKPNRLYKNDDDIQDYIYEIKTSNSEPLLKELGGKMVEIYPPGEYEVIKGEPGEHKLKKISIRGNICDGNNSGRFFERYLKNFTDQLNYLYKVPQIGNDCLDFRYFQNRKNEKFKNGFYYQGKPTDNKQNSSLPFPNYFDFENDFTHVHSEGNIPFLPGKKPVNLMKLILHIGIKAENAVILDLFAGSASLAQAALELNKEDQLCRKVILCNSNEYQIIENITYARLRNVIQGYVLDRVKKDELYAFSLTSDFIRKRGKELDSKFASIQEKHKESYEKITEIIEDNCYKIYGVFSKGYKVAGVGNSLKYFKVVTSDC